MLLYVYIEQNKNWKQTKWVKAMQICSYGSSILFEAGAGDTGLWKIHFIYSKQLTDST